MKRRILIVALVLIAAVALGLSLVSIFVQPILSQEANFVLLIVAAALLGAATFVSGVWSAVGLVEWMRKVGGKEDGSGGESEVGMDRRTLSASPIAAQSSTKLGNVGFVETMVVSESDRAISVNQGGTYIESLQYVDLVDQPKPQSLMFVPVPAPKPLFGREGHIARVRDSVDRNIPVLLHGLGGMGKTAIAATVSERALSASGRFRDGVLWLNVKEKALEDLCDAAIRELELTRGVRLRSEGKPSLLRNRLGNRDLLIVLDDVTAGNPSARDWQRAVHPPNTPLLVTSRERQVGFKSEEVAELDRKSAMALLLYHANQFHRTIDNEEANELCATLGDHPLALMILGALLSYHPLSFDDVVVQLRETHQRIQDLQIGDRKDESVYISLDISWSRLADHQKRLMGLLSSFYGSSVGIILFQLATRLSMDTVEEAVESLYSQSMLRVVGGRLSAHSLVRAFVRASVGATEWKDMRRQMVLACQEYVEINGEEDAAAHDALEAERENIFGAGEWAVRNDMHHAAQQLALILGSQSKFIETRAHHREALPLIQAAVKAAAEAGERGNEAEHLLNLGASVGSLGNLEEAIGHTGRALELAKRQEDEGLVGRCLINLGTHYSQLGNQVQAIKYYEEALAVARDMGARRLEGWILGNLGNAYGHLEEFEQAIEKFKEARAIAQEVGDRRIEGKWIGNIAISAPPDDIIHSVEARIQQLTEALRIARNERDRRSEGVWLGNLGSIYRSRGQAEKATEHLKSALKIAREIGDRHYEGLWLYDLGQQQYQLEDYEAAIDHYESARNIASEVGDRVSECNAVGQLGNCHYGLNDFEKAERLYLEQWEIAESVGHRAGKINAIGNLGNIYANLGRIAKAIEYYDEARKICMGLSDKSKERQWTQKAARAYRDIGFEEAATKYYEKVLILIQEEGKRLAEGQYSRELGRHFLEMGRTDLATAHLDVAIAVDPQDAGAHWSRAVACLREGEHDAALSDLLKAAELGTDDFPVHHWIGDIYFSKGQYKKAIESFEKAVELDSNPPEIYNRIGLAYRRLGDYKKAVDAYKIAIQISAEQSGSYWNLVIAARMGGIYYEALDALQALLELDPNSCEAHIGLAGTYDKLGLQDKSMQHLSIARKIMDREPPYTQACFHSVADDTDQALNSLLVAARAGQIDHAWAAIDPDLEAAREQPGFWEIVVRPDG